MKSILIEFAKFARCQSGETMIYTTIMFSAAVIVMAVAAAPFLDKASKDFANQRSYGVDLTTTASVRQAPTTTKTYTVRRSVFDRGFKKICKSGESENC